MKIAVIDHVGNHGGGSRVVRALLPALKRCDPALELTYFGNPASIRREGLASLFSAEGICVTPLKSLALCSGSVFGSPAAARLVAMAQTRWRGFFSQLPQTLSGDATREVEHRVRGFDLAYFPWPYLLRLPQLECPVVATFHDFNFKYFFSGAPVFSQAQQAQLDHEVPQWLARAIPVVSTHFMATELASFYPQAAPQARVVHLPALGGATPVEPALAESTVRALGICSPYLLYPTHMCSHKNVGPLIAALALLRGQGRDVRLVLTGAGTDRIRGHASGVGVRLDREGGDVTGLGYVSNLQMDSLIQRAAVVVSTSLYEAGNGPGLDAWGRGTPVAMSNIPAFLEHLQVQDVRAQVFDPRSPQDIAAKIAAILDNPVTAREDALHSMRALNRMTWDDTARKYLQIFRGAAAARGSSVPPALPPRLSRSLHPPTP